MWLSRVMVAEGSHEQHRDLKPLPREMFNISADWPLI